MLNGLLQSLLQSAVGQFFKWLLAKLLPSSSAPSAEAVAQREKDRADAAEQTIVDIARGKAARDRVRNDADDIVRDPDNAG